MSPRKQRGPDNPGPRADRPTSGSEAFPIDVVDRGDDFLVQAELPGLRKQDIDVGVKKDRLQIVARFGDEEGRFLRQERERGRASRVITLPDPVDEKRVSASYNDGVLWLTLPKWNQPKRVEVE
jgi:HSP20 family protein